MTKEQAISVLQEFLNDANNDDRDGSERASAAYAKAIEIVKRIDGRTARIEITGSGFDFYYK
jgi:hypothetical protein